MQQELYNRRNLYTFSDSVQMTKGRHQLSFGVWFQRMQDNEKFRLASARTSHLHQPD